EARLIDDLLDLTRITSGKLQLVPENCDVHALVQDALKVSCADCMDDVTVSLEATRHHIWADAARVLQILWNVLSNAHKFTPGGGSICVATSNSNGDTVRIEIRDSGIGIEPGLLPKIFDAFEQGNASATRRFGGLGLGLAIAKALVDAHRGTIEAHSSGP